MAQEKLRLGYRLFCALIAGLSATVLPSTWADEQPLGMTLLFQCADREVVVKRFDPDGVRGPVPGAVGGMFPRGGAIMSFMPGDRRGGVPKFVDLEWVVHTPEFKEWSARDQLKSKVEQYSAASLAEYHREWAKLPHYTKRIELTPIITPEMLAQVRADAQNTQLKLIITFNNDEVDIKALAYKWR